MDNTVLSVVLLLSLVDFSEQQYVAAQCLVPSNPGEDFTFIFRLCPMANVAITGLQTYDATEVPNYVTMATGASCSTSQLDDAGAFELTIGAMTGQSTCGLSQSGSTYEFAVIAEGAGIFYRVTCDTSNLQTLPTIVSETDYGTLHPKMHLEYTNQPTGVQFDVFAADGTNAPVNFAYLGQDLRIQLSYNQGFEEQGTTNWGFNFHTAFLMPRTGTHEYALEIVTPGIGTLVEIEIGQNAWTRIVFVKRNHRAYVVIPSELVTGTYNQNVWQTFTDGGIKINARDGRIGVRAISTRVTSSSSDSFVILPDELLGMSYTISTGRQNTKRGEIVLVLTESSTSVTFNFGSAAVPTSIAGETVSGADPFTLTSSLDDNNILRIYCERDCGHLVITADKPFAVVAGHNPSAQSVSVNQLTPDNRLGNRHVLTDLPTVPMLDLDEFAVRATQAGEFLNSSASSTAIADDDDATYRIPTNDMAIEVKSSGPMHIFKKVRFDASGDKERAAFEYPSISQWGIHQSFYASEGNNYQIYVVAEKGLTADITVTAPGSSISYNTLGDAPNFGTDRVDVVPISGQPKYEVYYNDGFLDVTSESDAGLVEFRSGSNTKPFMLLIVTFPASTDDVTVNVPFGQRYPPQCTPAAEIELNRGGFYYGNTTANIPGDTLDNDCDGHVDEEDLNGRDDDGDGLIDEDLALGPLLPFGIKVTKLEVAADVSFTGMYVHTIIEDGCLTSDATGVFGDLGPFTHRTDLDSVFDNYWVLTSPVFGAFKLPNLAAPVYFRVEYGFCPDIELGSDSECTNSCQPPARKKRDLTDSKFSLSTVLQIKDGNTSTTSIQDDSSESHPCRLEPFFLISVILLLMMLLIESISVCYMLVKRSQLRP